MYDSMAKLHQVCFQTQQYASHVDCLRAHLCGTQELQYTKQLCRQEMAIYEAQSKERMNRTLYLLTVVTTVIAPAQLFTSLYGMVRY